MAEHTERAEELWVTACKYSAVIEEAGREISDTEA